MKSLLILIMVFAFPCYQNQAATAAYTMPSTEVIPIKDSAARQYELYVKLPESYTKEPDKFYPVIYFTDAVWHIDALSAATEYMLEDVILVGISWQKELNGEMAEIGIHASRFRDYTMREHKNPKIQAKYNPGQANKHLAFIRNKVFTYIDDNYRTYPKSRTYFGYSLGGEFGAFTLLTQPGTFDNYILGSPAIDGEIEHLSELNKKFGAFEPSHKNSMKANVFISYGSLEKEASTSIEEFIRLLKDRRDIGLSLQTKIVEGSHETAFPLTAIKSIAWLSTLINQITSNNAELSLLEVPQLNKAFINQSPENRNDGLTVGKLGIDGGNKDAIIKLAEEIADHKQGRFDSFLIAHKDKLLFESYYGRGRINRPHQQASATKAHVAILLGRAIQLGYLTMEDLDKPLINFLDNLDTTKLVAGAEKITLHKALSMRGGLTINKEQWNELKKDSNAMRDQGQVQALLEISEPITADTQRFSYGNYNPDLVMQVIEAVVPGTASEFLEQELLGKLGITNYVWKTTVSGIAEADERSELTSRDMLKFGLLASNKGKWNGEQLIPEAFIAKAISPLLYTDADYEIHYGGKDVLNQGYGYFWWNADLKAGNKTYFSSSAQGGWGQFIILVEKLDLIIVFTGLDNDTDYLQLAAERILPAFME